MAGGSLSLPVDDCKFVDLGNLTDIGGINIAIQIDKCTPYLSGVLFHIIDVDLAAVESIKKEIQRFLKLHTGSARNQSEKVRRFQTVAPDIVSSAKVHSTALHYSESKQPPWYDGSEIKDTLHQIVIVTGHGNLVAITFSEPTARNLVVKEIKQATKGAFAKLKILSRNETELALVEDQVRTLWLSGTHRQSVVKPDSKQLSGLALESAIDPLDDQSYYYSSVRSTIENDHLAVEGKNAVVGTSPQQGRFWVSPTRSWADFFERMGLLLAHVAVRLNAKPVDEKPLPMLAQPTYSLDGVAAPYGVALIVPEALRADFNAEDDERWYQQFADAVTFELTTQDEDSNFEADVFWGDKQLGRLAFTFEHKEGISVSLNILAVEWDAKSEHDIAFRKICLRPNNFTIYFDTGHTFSGGHIYRTSFRDPKFEDWQWVKMSVDKTDFGKEKPNKDGSTAFAAEKIGTKADKSLFGLVARHWPNLATRGKPEGWLICDDGAMESADFIHIDNKADPPILSLIHVKGSGHDKKDGKKKSALQKAKEREISVSDYEVVVGQTVKNLRYLDQGNLLTKLSGNVDKRLVDAVWYNGDRHTKTREDFLGIVGQLGSRYQSKVYVLQPRVRKNEWEKTLEKINDNDKNNVAADSTDVLRLKQLDTLLQGARADCFALGADFTVIADDDGDGLPG